MDETIIKKLTKNIKETNLNKSSHWIKYLPDNSNYFNVFEHRGFGGFTKKNAKNIFHNILKKIVFGNRIFRTKTYFEYKSVFDKIEELHHYDESRN